MKNLVLRAMLEEDFHTSDRPSSLLISKVAIFAHEHELNYTIPLCGMGFGND
jgi:hypothetical protein